MIARISTIRYRDTGAWVGVSYRQVVELNEPGYRDLERPLGGTHWVIRFQMPSRP